MYSLMRLQKSQALAMAYLLLVDADNTTRVLTPHHWDAGLLSALSLHEQPSLLDGAFLCSGGVSGHVY
jgi:hypothetical protein